MATHEEFRSVGASKMGIIAHGSRQRNAQARRESARRSRFDRTERPYPPIRDYALIGDCHGAALVARDGSVDWCCLGRFDAAPALWRILDADKGGFFQITPIEDAEIDRAYLRDTNILRTTFRTTSGRASVIDFMPVGRAPGVAADDYITLNAPSWLVRIVKGEEGHVRLRVRFQSQSKSIVLARTSLSGLMSNGLS